VAGLDGVTGMERHRLLKPSVTISTRIKRRVVFAAIVFLAIWPMVHHVIVTTYEINPWIYFGLSMYAKVSPRPEIVALEAAYPGQPFQSVNRNTLRASLPLKRSIWTLAFNRQNYGTLYNPEPIVAEMFDPFPPDINRLAFTMRVLNLNAEGTMVAKDTRTECRKGKERGEVECVVAPVAGRTRSP